MNRRNALKNLGLITGGIILLPSCNYSDEKVSIILNKLQITIQDEKLLKVVIATIIPEGEILGASSLKVHNFVWVMIDDVLSEEKQRSLMNGLKLLDGKVKELSGSSFINLSENNRLTILEDILNGHIKEDKSKNKKDLKDIKSFVKTAKYYAIWGYMQSEYMMTKIMPYELVPGKYGSCKKIDSNKRVNING
ncbi:MAG: gluconate 2-dehydrogenase subunit 3 family protein [Flavobacteriaceae bacterium]|nr:gluconate 2-dehydrogenase subunit 3 family protein [Flavobacteriaceae bacterium]